MSTQTITDIAALVGEMEALVCEHGAHTQQPQFHSDEAASHYGQSRCECGYISKLIPLCPRYVAVVQSGMLVRCRSCGVAEPANKRTTILAPVNK